MRLLRNLCDNVPAFNSVRSTAVKYRVHHKSSILDTRYYEELMWKRMSFCIEYFHVIYSEAQCAWSRWNVLYSLFQARDSTEEKGPFYGIRWIALFTFSILILCQRHQSLSLIKSRHKNYNYLQQSWEKTVVEDINLLKKRENVVHL